MYDFVGDFCRFDSLFWVVGMNDKKCISRTEKFEFLVLVLLVFVIMVCISYFGNIIFDRFLDLQGGDAEEYLNMSYYPFEGKSPPFMYRILTPLIVYLLPLNHLNGFIIINLISLFLTAILLYYYLKKLDFRSKDSLIGVLFFLLSPVVIFTMNDIVLVDALSFLLLLLTFYAILCKNDILYLFFLILGILNKETVLLTIPLFFLYKLENNKLIDTLKSTIILLIPVFIVFIGIRFYVGFSSYYTLDLIESIISYHLRHSYSIFYIPWEIYTPFGLLWIISLLNLIKIDNNFIHKSFYLLPIIFIQSFIATDIFRMLFIAFPIIIPMSLYIFRCKYSIQTFSILFCLSTVIIFTTLYRTENIYATILNILLSILIWVILLILLLKKFSEK